MDVVDAIIAIFKKANASKEPFTHLLGKVLISNCSFR